MYWSSFFFSYNLLFIRVDCLKVGLDLQESLNFVTNSSLRGVFFKVKMGALVHVEVITTTMECCIAYLCSLFSEVVHYRKSVKQRKPKAAINGACHRFSKSVSVDGQKNADKNWSVQPILFERAFHFWCIICD